MLEEHGYRRFIWISSLLLCLIVGWLVTSITSPLKFAEAAKWAINIQWAIYFSYLLCLFVFLVIPDKKSIINLWENRDKIDIKVILFRSFFFVFIILILSTLLYLCRRLAMSDTGTVFSKDIFGIFGLAFVSFPVSRQFVKFTLFKIELKLFRKRLRNSKWYARVPFLLNFAVNVFARYFFVKRIVRYSVWALSKLINPFSKYIANKKIQEAIEEKVIFFILEAIFLTTCFLMGWAFGYFS